MAEFNFIDRYHNLQPSAPRDVMAARQEAFKVVAQEATQPEKIVDLTRIALGLPHPVGSTAPAWLASAIKAKDEMFGMLDREEAARMASLVMSQRLALGSLGAHVAILAAYFGENRRGPEAESLATEARNGLARLVRTRGADIKIADLEMPTAATFSEEVTKFDADNGPITEIVDAIAKDYRTQITTLVNAANAAIGGLRTANQRLAEEVDLLWWHLGGHSFLLDKPLSSLPQAVLPIVVGMDTASMVNRLPGPYGTYGVIRRALGENADRAMKLSELIEQLQAQNYIGIVTATVKDAAMAPIHAVVAEVVLNRAPMTNDQFRMRTGLHLDLVASQYEFALQAYHERLLIKQNWVL
ncbi:hypothetical protein FHT86_000818 [Rhizobium sp. BK313]|uniref:GTPase-associated system all-helical protein GASH n=1 Tax=Rhizobium sp. BK313 TaxID=2587081 RepID=UPI00105F60CF|nr:GTPase-associated system all-helical protein GASH [Rhizobium sp. BK313]MBB3452562.1 hypothetical protein [Rhizobium sp. BK313]